MRRERRVIFEKLYQLDREEACELEMGCGFGTKEISEAFAPQYQALQTQLAATYGLSVEDYYNREMEIAMSIPGGVPFN